MGNAILYRMASGIPGDISRRAQSIVEQVVLDATKPFLGFGQPGKISAGKFVPLEANDPASVIYGFFVRPYPTQTSNAAGTGVSSGLVGDCLRLGFMTVKNNSGTPAMNGQVYIRVANVSGPKPLGGVEAASEVAVTGAAVGGNTGNGTIGTLSATASAVAGAYKLTMTTATTFTVADPNGAALKPGATGVAYTAGGVTFTVTAGGTPMVAGDAFTATVVPGTVLLPSATFKDAGDASGNVEIEFKLA